ncbi:MAG: FixH family protein [Planctomycetota bacterium]
MRRDGLAVRPPRVTLPVLLCGFGALAACGPSAAPLRGAALALAGAPSAAALSWSVACSERGGFTARWRPVPDPIPVNEPFELDLRIERGDTTAAPHGEPIADAEVFVHAWMPDHRHGMLRRPVATPASRDGDYRVRGMLFHMGGTWQLFVDVILDGELERVRFDLELP